MEYHELYESAELALAACSDLDEGELTASDENLLALRIRGGRGCGS